MMIIALLLMSLLDGDVKALKDVIWAEKVIIVKGQQDLLPIKQWELVTRFDPEAPQVHSHGTLNAFNKNGGILSVRDQLCLCS